MPLFTPPAYRRFGYDRDGSTVYNYDVTTAAITTLTTAQVKLLNDEDASVEYRVQASGGARQAHLDVYFPSARTIRAMFLSFGSDHSGAFLGIDVSSDSTAPNNGTWTAVTYTQNAAGAVNPEYRQQITAVGPLTNVKAIRIRTVGTDTSSPPFDKFYVYAWHIFGDYTSTLRMWDPTSDVELDAAALDFGDVSQSETYTAQFRVKNTHGSLTAQGVVVGTDVVTDASPGVGGQIDYDDGTSSGASINIGDLAAGAISDVITMTYAVDAGAQLGAWAWRTVADPASMV